MAEIAKIDYSKPPSNDPPGMIVFWEPDDKHFDPDGDGEWHVYLGDQDAMIGAPSCWWKRCAAHDKQRMEAEARTAAWAWYDLRLSLANTHNAAWPECLAWSNEICAEVVEGQPESESVRQSKEHAAATLDLVDFSDAPPGWKLDPICGWAYEAGGRRRPIDVAWTLYKAEHNPPGMWCGFARSPIDMENCTLRAGVSACGARWELALDIRVPYKGWVSKAREWAWAYHDRRHALMRELQQKFGYIVGNSDMYVVGNVIRFHRVMLWHDEWVAEVETWLKDVSEPFPEALLYG